jgi:Luciferase
VDVALVKFRAQGSAFRVRGFWEMIRSIANAIEGEVRTWPGVTVASHGSGFIEFRIGRRELGHLHGSRLADLPFPVRIREQLVSDGKAQLHHAHPESGWVSFYIQSADDISAVIDLFRLNYQRPWLSALQSRR